MYALVIVAVIITLMQSYLTWYLLHNQSYGCLNRAAFNLMYPVLRALGYKFITCDVDKFKSLNTTYGHEEVNRMVQGALRRFSRSGDLVFSVYSGDEFIVATRSPLVHTIAHRLMHVFAWHGMSLTTDVVNGTLETSMLKILSNKSNNQ